MEADGRLLWITKPIVEANERAKLGLEEGLGVHNFIP